VSGLAPAAVIALTAIAAGTWIGWVIRPVVMAFGAGLKLGKIRGRQEAEKRARTTAAR